MASSNCKRSSSGWSDLRPDLLGLVLPHLHSLIDRVRAGAACRPWRSAARLHLPNLPPPMPWLALGYNAYLDVVNGGAAARKLSLGFVPARCRGSADHLLFLTRGGGGGGGGGCFLADPFTGAVLPVADLAMFIEEQTREEVFSLGNSINLHVHKVVLLWPPHGGGGDSPAPPPVVAALIKDGNNKLKTTIFVCRAGTETGVTKERYGSMSINLRLIKDVAFFDVNLYALSTHDQLLVIGIGEGSAGGGGGNPTITGVKYVIESPYGQMYDNFEDEEDHEMDDLDVCQGVRPAGDERLVQSGDQLLMLRRWVIDDGTSGGGGTGIFDVYEADFGATSPCRWKTASSLRGRALFLGRYCSKSVPVGDGHYGAQEDCIYFVQHDAEDSGIYDMEYCKVRPLVPNIEDVLWFLMEPWTPTWIFPDQSIIQAHYLEKSTAQGASDDEFDDHDSVFDFLFAKRTN
ncbi:unnamed protein product [Urochloa humidicola]